LLGRGGGGATRQESWQKESSNEKIQKGHPIRRKKNRPKIDIMETTGSLGGGI